MRRPVVRFTAVFVVLGVIFVLINRAAGPTKSSGTAVFNPEDYRPEIEALETVLYMGGPPDYADVDRAGLALANLYQAVVERETRLAARERARELVFLSSRADVSDVGFAAPELGDLRASWEQSRVELFGEADWFRRSTAELSETRTPAVAPPTATEIYELTRVIDRLEDLIRDGRLECDDLGEPLYEAEYVGVEGRAQIEAWRVFALDWDERLSHTASFMPSQPSFDGYDDFLFAYQDVGSAFGELRLVPVGVGDWATPFKYHWDQHFSAAESYLSRARQRLAATD